KDALQINPEMGVPIVFVNLVQLSVATHNAGVVHDDVEPSPGLHGFVHHALRVLGFGNVAGLGDAGVFGHFSGGFAQDIVASRRDDDLRSFGDKTPRDLQSDSAASAGDERDFIDKTI